MVMLGGELANGWIMQRGLVGGRTIDPHPPIRPGNGLVLLLLARVPVKKRFCPSLRVNPLILSLWRRDCSLLVVMWLCPYCHMSISWLILNHVTMLLVTVMSSIWSPLPRPRRSRSRGTMRACTRATRRGRPSSGSSSPTVTRTSSLWTTPAPTTRTSCIRSAKSRD